MSHEYTINKGRNRITATSKTKNHLQLTAMASQMLDTLLKRSPAEWKKENIRLVISLDIPNPDGVEVLEFQTGKIKGK